MLKILIFSLLLLFVGEAKHTLERLALNTWVVDEYFDDGDYLYQEYSFIKIDDTTFIHKTFAKKAEQSELMFLSESRLILSGNKVKCSTADTSLHLKYTFEHRNIYLDYDYVLHGRNATMRDSWIYQNDSSFNFIIGEWDGNKYTKIYMETPLKRR
jgi:hypothetical protein